jgi:hypothetical protein
VKPLALARNPSLRSAFAFALGGVAFAGGNLLLADLLSARDYGLFSLVVAVIQVVMVIGPLGAEVVVNRHLVRATPALLLRVLATSTGIALAAVAISAALYELDRVFLALLFVGGVAAAANWVAAACFARELRFGVSLWLSQGANAVILASVLPVWALERTGELPTAIVCSAYVLMAIGGWALLIRENRTRAGASAPRSVPWAEGIASVSILGTTLVMVQGERLITPAALSLEDLAALAVLSVLVASPFRILQQSNAHSLLPRLRVATDAMARRRLMLRECALAALFCSLICVAVWSIEPIVEHGLLDGKYALDRALVLAVLIVGIAKVVDSIASTVVNALGSASELRALSQWSWLSALTSIAAGYFLSRMGLAGIVAGVGAGWCLRALAALTLARRHFASAGTDSRFQRFFGSPQSES